MNRLIIESIEGRITLGITMFVAIMILIGWVALNEQGRMAEFVEQHEGRAIERGAELFAANCSTCHGINGLGISGRAPALNNPQFFGYSYLGSVNFAIAAFERDLVDINGVSGVQDVTDRLGSRDVLLNRKNELLDEIVQVSDAEARDLLVELGNIDAQLTDNIGEVSERIVAIEAGEPIGDDALNNLSDAELQARLAALNANIPARLFAAEVALNGENGLYAEREAQLEELSGAMLRGYLPELEAHRALAEETGYPLFLTNYIATDADRLAQIEFGGGVENYVTTTLIHGRPGSGDVWNGNIMVAWSQRAGGSLRDDDISDLVAYITNWNKDVAWTLDDFLAVNQYAIIHEAYNPNATVSGDGPAPVGTDIDEIMANLPEGDAVHGEALYNGGEATQLGGVVGCQACHLGGAVGPDTVGTWTRVEQIRLAQPEFEGYTGVQYLVESIIAPNAYIVPGTAGGMIPNYGEQLSIQDLADIVSYLQTQNQ